MIANKTQALAKITGNRSVIPFVTTEEHRPKKKKKKQWWNFCIFKNVFSKFLCRNICVKLYFLPVVCEKVPAHFKVLSDGKNLLF